MQLTMINRVCGKGPQHEVSEIECPLQFPLYSFVGGRSDRAWTLAVETLAWTLGHQTLGDYNIGHLGHLQLMLKSRKIPVYLYI